MNPEKAVLLALIILALAGVVALVRKALRASRVLNEADRMIEQGRHPEERDPLRHPEEGS